MTPDMTQAPERIWLASPETAEEYGEPITSPNRHPMAPPVKEYIRADLARPRVKPLVWYPTEDICDDVRAQNYAGIWIVFKGAEDMWVLDTGEFVSEHDTLEEAKSAAQADYERRIMEALE